MRLLSYKSPLIKVWRLGRVIELLLCSIAGPDLLVSLVLLT